MPTVKTHIRYKNKNLVLIIAPKKTKKSNINYIFLIERAIKF